MRRYWQSPFETFRATFTIDRHPSGNMKNSPNGSSIVLLPSGQITFELIEYASSYQQPRVSKSLLLAVQGQRYVLSTQVQLAKL